MLVSSFLTESVRRPSLRVVVRGWLRSTLVPCLLCLLGVTAPVGAQTTRVSVATGGAQGTTGSSGATVSGDGRYVAFSSSANNLVSDDTNGTGDVFVHDRVTGMTTRESVAPGGGQSTGYSGLPALSSDARYVAFHSAAPNLVTGDSNGVYDVFVRDRVTATTTRVSVATGGGQATGGDSFFPALSSDGRYVAFHSAASNLVSGDTNGLVDVFVHDTATGATTRVSVATGGGQATGDSFGHAISGDGRYVAFTSRAPNLVTGDTNGVLDVFVHDLVTGATTRASVATGGGQTTVGESYEPSLSRDGRYVAFSSIAPNLVAGDTNGIADVFVHDRVTEVTTRVSVGISGAQATDADSGLPAVSGDGRYVTFSSAAPNLVAGDTNGRSDVFVHDRATGATTRASVAAGGSQADGESLDPAVSADGRYVVFYSNAPNLSVGDTNASFDVFVYDARMFQRRRVSVMTGGGQATLGSSFYPTVSGDGRYVAFQTDANLVPDDTNDGRDVYVHDRASATTSRVSVATGGGEATGGSGLPALSGDGRYVAFQSTAPNLVPGDTNAEYDVFVHDRVTGATTRVSVATGGDQANGYSVNPALSEDGRYVVFSSFASNLVAGDTNGIEDVFLHDRVTGETTRVSVTTSGSQATGGDSFDAAVSGDGRYAVFSSKATNLVAGDTNGKADIFVHDRATGTTARVSVATGGGQATGADSFLPTVSGDGRYVAFASDASNLVAADTNNGSDVFVHDRVTGATTRVSVVTGGGQATGGYSYESALSEDGRYVAFYSTMPNLVAGDSNNWSDIFVHDRVTGETVRASLGPGESEANSASGTPVLSADGRVLVYQSSATNLVAGDTNAHSDVFVRAATPVLSVVAPRSGPTTGGTTVHVEGAGFQPGTTATVGGLPAVNLDGTNPARLAITTPANVAGVTDVVVTVPGFDPERLVDSYTYVAVAASPTGDTDGDGMPDVFEVQYSLDPLDASDAGQDSDGDGVTNRAEYEAGTHPKGTVTRYLAEGATSNFFRTALALTNPGAADANVLLRFLPSAGSPISHALHVPPHSRRTVDVESVSALATAEFSTVLESDQLVVLDRTMRWDATGYGSHTETALPALATTWYLAEGATHSGFELFYLLQNAAPTQTTVQVTFFRPAPLAPVVKSYTLEPQSRFNIWVDTADVALANTDVSAKIVASQPIAVERAMYLSKGDQLFTAGHQSAGVTAPGLSWFLAEGATGSFFDLFVLLSNPNTSTANVTVTFLKPDGSTIVKTYVVAAQSRFNIWVDLEDPALANTAVSTTVQVTNGVPIVVERSMWWPGDAATWHEAHNSPGATSTGTAWVIASGEDGGPSNAETYVLIANTGLVAATVNVTVLLEDGGTVTEQYVVPAQSRWNVAMRVDFPSAVGQRFGVLVESVGLGAPPVVVESAVYSDADGVVWAAGANALATKLRD